MNQWNVAFAATGPAQIDVIVVARRPKARWAAEAARSLDDCGQAVRLVVVSNPEEVVLGSEGIPMMTYETHFMSTPYRRESGWVLYYHDSWEYNRLGSHFLGGGPTEVTNAVSKALSWLSEFGWTSDGGADADEDFAQTLMQPSRAAHSLRPLSSKRRQSLYQLAPAGECGDGTTELSEVG